MSAAEDQVMKPATVEFELDGRKVHALEGETILQAAEREGTVIPRLCYTPGYRPDGNCRACVVEVDGDIAPSGLRWRNHARRYRGRELPPCKVCWQNEIRLRFAIKAVQPGQLRDMCAQVGLQVVAIRRIRIGKVPLGKMPVGEWRYLPAGEKF